MAKSDTKRVKMLDTIEDTTSDLVKDENGKKRLAYQTVRLLKDQEYDLPADQADDLVAKGFAAATKAGA